MEGLGLQGGFRIGVWLIEARELSVSRVGVVFVVPPEHTRVLWCLVESRGEFADRRTLPTRAFEHKPHAAQELRQAITAWHTVFGDTPRHPRYIAASGQDGCSLIAHVEPMQWLPRPERLVAAGRRTTATPGSKRTLVGWALHLLGELRRRGVFRVAAIYLVGMRIRLQVAAVTIAPLHLTGWWITVLTILAVVGMPIVLAWTYEITSDGLVRDSEAVAAARLRPGSRRRSLPASS